MNDLLPAQGLSEARIGERIDAVLAAATLAEKVGMMSGKGFFAAIREDRGVWGARPYRAGGGIDRLGVPAFYFTDGPRGVARGQSTCFPCTMARGAGFDVDLERRIGAAMGIEIRAQGCNLNGAVCINLLRHPAWGRAQETYGEDPCHLGEMGAALATGIQSHNVAATVKHFALNSMENTRFEVDVAIDDRTLHEVYLPHFKTVIDAGVMTVMSAYNKVNGEYCGQNARLLTEILCNDWGFDGFVHSDWVMGVYQLYGAAAGLDVENPEPLIWGDKLVAAVEAGTVAPSVVDTACRRILRVLYRIACAQDPLPDYPVALVASDDHVALALEAAEKSAVLLKNDEVLPLSRQIGRLAVLGRLAALVNTGDNGSSRVRAPHVVTAIEGLQAAIGADRIVTGDETDLAAAGVAAASAEAVVVVVGYTAQEEGEFIPGDLTLGQDLPAGVPDAVKEARSARRVAIGGDRIELGLPADQIALIATAAATGKPVIVVIVAGSAVMVETWCDTAAAILQTFYSGMAGGSALARLLFGDVSPSGRLPFTVARDADDYPFFDRDAKAITYDYWHGYAKLARDGVAARFPFGHGLSYSAFTVRALTVRRSGDTLVCTMAVTNDGAMTADHVVLLWSEAPGLVQPYWQRKLAGFARVSLAPGEMRFASIVVPLQRLRWRDPTLQQWRLEAGDWLFVVADTAEATAVTTATLRF